MELSHEECAVLGRDSFDKIVIRYSLNDYPTIEWTKLFNRITSIIAIRSIVNSKSILVTADPNAVLTFNLASLIQEKIEKTENQLNSDALKNQIILEHFIPGLIVVHSDMGYENQSVTEENPNGYSEYELYLMKIIERIQEHDEYEEQLNAALSAV